MNVYKKFTLQYIFITFLICLALICFNWFVNPYNIYKSASIQNINAVKPLVTSHLRLAKAMAIEWKKPKNIIAGSSTAETGLNPAFSSWHTKDVYNMGLSGANIYEVMRYLQHAQVNGPLKKVVLAVNFFMFNAYLKNRSDFNESILDVDKNGKKNYLTSDSLFSTLLSYDALKASISTIQKQNLKNAFLSNGQLVLDYRVEQVNRLKGYKNNFLYVESYNKSTFLQGPLNEYDFYDNKNHINTLSYMQEIINLCNENNTELTVILVPEHVRLLETYKLLGLWEKYEQWQGALVKLIHLHNQRYPNNSYAVWNFNKINQITTEVLPLPKDNLSIMKWFWDPFHFKNELGELILSNVLDSNYQSLINDFSTKLTQENLEEELRSNKLALYYWEKQNFHQVKELQESLFKKA